MFNQHDPVGVVEGVVLDKPLKSDLEIWRLALFQLFNIRLPFEVSLLKAEILYRCIKLVWSHENRVII